MNKQKVFAIDLGTTFSEFGFLGEDGRPEIIKNPSGKQKLETAVRFKNGGGKQFGSSAARAAPVYPDKVLKEFKPDFDRAETQFNVDGKQLKPIEVSELFFGHMKSRIEEATGGTAKNAVITAPAYFHNSGTEVLKLGAENAGFEIERILREPASAAVGYAINSPLNDQETVLVYDFGGGTFDVSLLEVKEDNGSPRFDILGNQGRTDLGGKDFTRKIVNEVFAKQFLDEFGTDPSDKPEVKAEWIKRAEEMKRGLSENESEIDYIQGESEHLSIELTRDEFETLIEPKVDETLEITEKLLVETSRNKSEVDRLVLVGGTTRVPLVKNKIKDFTGLESEKGVDPDLAVVTGAILIAGAKGNQTIRDQNGVRVPLLASEVRDVTSHSIGVKAVDLDTNEEYHEILVQKGEALRAVGKQKFHPVQDNAEEVELTVIEGDSRDLDECKILQEGYKLKISTPKKRENVDIEVGLAVNKNGIIEVIAETEFGDEFKEEFKNPSIIN